MASNTARRMPRLEVYPERVAPMTVAEELGVADPASDWQVRLKGANGKVMLYSGSEGYSERGAIAAARAVNTTVAQGRLQIRVLDADGKVRRVIEPIDSGDITAARVRVLLGQSPDNALVSVGRVRQALA